MKCPVCKAGGFTKLSLELHLARWHDEMPLPVRQARDWFQKFGHERQCLSPTGWAIVRDLLIFAEKLCREKRTRR